MKKLLLLLALISTFAFGIDKKTPTGGTVKDKPGKSQNLPIQTVLKVYGDYTCTGTSFQNVLSLPIPNGNWIIYGYLNADAAGGTTRIDYVVSKYSGNTTTDHTNQNAFYHSPYNFFTNMQTFPYNVYLTSQTTYYLKVACHAANIWLRQAGLMAVKIGD